MRAQLYNVARRTLSQATRDRLKRRMAHARLQLAPLYRARHGTFDADDLGQELQRHLPQDAEVLMVHCSFNDLRPAYVGTVAELLDVLLRLCGPDRTLAMPAFFFGGPAADPVAHYRRKPVFDARRQPSEMGILSEAFRRRPGVRRSLHPTASVCALGPLADEIVGGHHLAPTSFGPGTPLTVMAEHRTAIIGIGTEYFRCLSQIHAAEDLLGDRYPLVLRSARLPVQLRDVDGTTHDYDLPIDECSLHRRTNLLEHLLGPDELVRWRCHGVPLFVVSAARVTEALIDAALRGETIYDEAPIRPRRPRLAPGDRVS